MRVSRNFVEREFRCRHCGQVKIDPHLVEHLEKLRAKIGRPLRIVSGYRCPTHNRAVGGARNSLHLTGQAADIDEGYATTEQAAAAGFAGIGSKGQWAVHLDVRRRSARWTY